MMKMKQDKGKEPLEEIVLQMLAFIKQQNLQSKSFQTFIISLQKSIHITIG